VTQEPQAQALATRRGMLAGAGLAGLAGVITACGGGGSSAAAALGGSGTIFTGPKVAVTQPAAGQFKAFSAICTHMGCIVGQVSNGTIDCPCHGSQYSIATGAVVAGPAPAPLPAARIKVSGGSVFLE
jgi:nitrite reductase/ring-hydroxylating ferredoxin subunit